jgi:hypothetical protein
MVAAGVLRAHREPNNQLAGPPWPARIEQAHAFRELNLELGASFSTLVTR